MLYSDGTVPPRAAGGRERAMDRGIQLACEQCDFAAALYERLPFAVDAAGQPQAVSPGSAQPAGGYWSDALCGECRMPGRAARLAGAAAGGAGGCAGCPRLRGEAVETREHAHAAVMATNTLVGRPAQVENAASVEAAVATMEERLRQTAGYVSALESCVEDESFLPGVPCPRCSTGHLVHWPLWL